MSVIVIEPSTVDGIVSEPGGSGGAPVGGRAFRCGPVVLTPYRRAR